jgi:enolase-phosphatase E1
MKRIQAVVADIEGTTSSIGFVHDVLFPYASRELPDFLRARRSAPEIVALLEDVRQEAEAPDAGLDRLTEILREWIAADRKVTPLKTLQGLIWEHGYENGDFAGHVYADTAPAFRRWTEGGAAIYIYSSGSVKAQELLFAHSEAGDLTPFIAGYFDTHVGHKRDPGSYRTIAARIGLPADAILFLSDTPEELDAAADAGMATMQIARDEPVSSGRHAVARDFDEVVI